MFKGISSPFIEQNRNTSYVYKWEKFDQKFSPGAINHR